MTFIDKTSSAKPIKTKDGKEIPPVVTLRVKVSNDIPFNHRMCR